MLDLLGGYLVESCSKLCT